MLLGGAFASILFLGLIVSDWLYFVRLTPDAVRYGCAIARLRGYLPQLERSALVRRFDGNGALVLPHGIARFFPETNLIGLRPHYRLFAMGFRTAWPRRTPSLAPRYPAPSRTCRLLPWPSLMRLSFHEGSPGNHRVRRSPRAAGPRAQVPGQNPRSLPRERPARGC